MAKELKFKQGSYKEAVEYFKKKINLPTKRWNDLEGAMHTRAFTVAGAMRADILLDFRKAVDAAIEKGESLQDFRDRFYNIASKWRESDPSFDEKMQRPKYGAWRSKVIYQTNILTSAAAAQERQARAMPDVFTHAKYVCMMMPTSRDQHKAWNGTVLPVNDPWWEKHSPPNGFGCLCEKEFISKYEMDAGLEKTTKAPTAPNDTTNIGEKWDYSIGDADAENQRLMDQMEEKEEKLFKKYPKTRKTAIHERREARESASSANTATAATELDLSTIKTIKAKPLNRAETVRERRAERIKRGKQFENIIQDMQEQRIEYNEVKKLEKVLTEQQIIEKLGSIDPTGGSCSSQALAYIANKYGLDVKDFRGGRSSAFFADNDNIKRLAKVGCFAVKKNNGFKNAAALLQHVEAGKEYYFTCGRHVAIIRKKGNNFEFLELQKKPENNGFKPLTSLDLKKRFKTTENFKLHDYLIDIEKLKDSPKFRELLGFLNTQGV